MQGLFFFSAVIFFLKFSESFSYAESKRKPEKDAAANSI
jgi:hypothetical protein